VERAGGKGRNEKVLHIENGARIWKGDSLLPDRGRREDAFFIRRGRRDQNVEDWDKRGREGRETRGDSLRSKIMVG